MEMSGKKPEIATEDPFVRTMKQMMTMPKDQVMKKVGELNKMCICGSCPTYTSCAKNAGESMFCAHGTSFHCITENKGCVCPTCPVTKPLGLKHQAYCMMGTEKAQRFDAMIR
jgi:hypothetical protein